LHIQLTATRVSKASKDSIWQAVEDLESWPKWSDSKNKNHVINNKIVSREGNLVVCDTDEVVNGLHAKHRGRITFYPKEKFTEEMIEGPDIGFFTWNFTETPQGTRMDLSLDVEPKTLLFKIGFRFNGKKVVQGVADEMNKQLSDYAETHPFLMN
jgi:ribosome-associated toxin RatA of RatAB toxin-antitoxin module